MKAPFLVPVILVFLAGFAAPLPGQDNMEGWKAINSAYEKYPRLSMDVTYKVFKSWDAVTPLQVEKGAIKRSGKKTWLKIGLLEFIQNPDYALVIDHDDKTISIMGIYGDLPEADYNTILAGVEKALGYCQEFRHKNLDNNRGKYEIVFPDNLSEYKKISLTYDKATHLLQGVTLYYAKTQGITDDNTSETPPRLEITYSSLNTDPSIAPDAFTYDAFLKKSDKILVCREKYRQYELIDKYSRP